MNSNKECLTFKCVCEGLLLFCCDVWNVRNGIFHTRNNSLKSGRNRSSRTTCHGRWLHHWALTCYGTFTMLGTVTGNGTQNRTRFNRFWFIMQKYSHWSETLTELGRIVSYCTNPVPCTGPFPGPIQCEWAITTDTKAKYNSCNIAQWVVQNLGSYVQLKFLSMLWRLEINKMTKRCTEG